MHPASEPLLSACRFKSASPGRPSLSSNTDRIDDRLRLAHERSDGCLHSRIDSERVGSVNDFGVRKSIFSGNIDELDAIWISVLVHRVNISCLVPVTSRQQSADSFTKTQTLLPKRLTAAPLIKPQFFRHRKFHRLGTRAKNSFNFVSHSMVLQSRVLTTRSPSQSQFSRTAQSLRNRGT